MINSNRDTTIILQKQITSFLPILQWNFADRNPDALVTLTKRVQDAIKARSPIPYSEWVKDVTIADSIDDAGNPRLIELGQVDVAGTEFYEYISLHSFADRAMLDSAIVAKNQRSTTSGRNALSALPTFYALAETLGVSAISVRSKKAFWEQELAVVYKDRSAWDREGIATIPDVSDSERSLTPIEKQIRHLFNREKEFDLLVAHLRELDQLAFALYRNLGKATQSRKSLSPAPKEAATEDSDGQSKSRDLLAEQGVLLHGEVFRTVSALADEKQSISLSRVAQELRGLNAMVRATAVVVASLEQSAVIRLPTAITKSSIQGSSLVPSNLPLGAQLRSYSAALGRSISFYQKVETYDIDSIGEGTRRLAVLIPGESAAIARMRKEMAQVREENRQIWRALQEMQAKMNRIFPELVEYDIEFFLSELGGSPANMHKRFDNFMKEKGYRIERGRGGQKCVTDRWIAIEFKEWFLATKRSTLKERQT